MIMAGLFVLVAVTIGLAIANRSRAALALFAVTLVLAAFTLRHHMTDVLAISL
jgi:hypothetical protein